VGGSGSERQKGGSRRIRGGLKPRASFLEGDKLDSVTKKKGGDKVEGPVGRGENSQGVKAGAEARWFTVEIGGISPRYYTAPGNKKQNLRNRGSLAIWFKE